MRVSLDKPSLNELTHYGVLGMRWGVRKKRPESDSIVKARKQLAKTSSNLKVEYRKKNQATLGGLIPSTVAIEKRISRAKLEKRFSKEDLSKAIILDRFKSKTKSKAQLSLEKQYKEKGMANDEATVAAYQNLATKKILMAAGGVTLAAVAGYTAYKHYDAKTDRLIKAGTLLQNISDNSTAGMRDAFYASSTSMDNIKYKGLLGSEMMFGDVYARNIQTLSDVKQGSYKTAHSTLSNLMKTDPEFSKGVSDYIASISSDNFPGRKLGATLKKARASLAKGIVDKNVYDMFNITIVDHGEQRQALTNSFFGKLTEKGYNAIRDVDDHSYSGYKAANPLITFNLKDKISVANVELVTNEQIFKSAALSVGQITASTSAKIGAAAILGELGVNAAKSSSLKVNSDLKKIAEYRKEHPNTKLMGTEIIRTLERRK